MEDVWRQKSDEQVVAAGGYLADYTEEARQVIRDEMQRRHLPEPPVIQPSDQGQKEYGETPSRPHRYKRNGALLGIAAGVLFAIGKAVYGSSSSDLVWDAAYSAGMFTGFGTLIGGIFDRL